MRRLSYLFLAMALAFAACTKNVDKPTANNETAALPGSLRVAATLTENFETGTKTAYTTANVTLGSGIWTLNDALIGTSASDAKNGLQSARVRNSGKLTMAFDKTGGAGTVTVAHAAYGSDTQGSWQLWYSTNSGASYTPSGGTITSATGALQTTTFTINVSGNVRIEIRKTDAGTNRINFDDIVINDYATSNPVPVLASISPNSCSAGAASFTLTVNGSNFINGSQILWNGSTLTTSFISATQLTASVGASLVSTAGIASVAVFTPTPGGGTSATGNFTINAVVPTGKKFLFDAKHAQTAGNADWVIDEDNLVPLRYPTPAQSTVTSSTTQSYWTGALSSWGIALVKLGHTVETLPTSGSVTYGNSNNPQDLTNYDVFVIDEPNIVFTASEKTALIQFVQNGGGLMMISDHTVSDRNNDGWDSPDIWNDFMTNNGLVSNPFGFSIDLTNINTTSTNIASVTTSPVLSGTQGTVTQVQFNNGATITINPTINANVKGLVWKSGVTKNNSNILCATSTYGTGRVFVLGDSSPVDDGSGNPADALFAGWSSYSHSKLLMNASLWVAKAQ